MLPRTARPFPGKRYIAEFFLLLFASGVVLADDRPRPIDPDGIRGTLMICGGGKLPESVTRRFIELAGGDKSRLVLISAAGDAADKQPADSWKECLFNAGVRTLGVLRTDSRDQADSADFVELLTKATGVCIEGGQQSRLAEVYAGTAVERELLALLRRGGVVAGTSAGAAIQSAVMIAGGNPEPMMSTGFDLLPGGIIDQHFRQRSREPRLRRAIEQHPACVGLGVDKGTAAIVRGRELHVLGDAAVTVCLAESKHRAAFERSYTSGALLDWVSLQRSARERAASCWPPEEPAASEVPNGALVIVGGGGMPRELTKRFIELAGGEESLIVVLPTAVPRPPLRADSTVGDGEARFLRAAGAKNVKVLDQRRHDIPGDKDFLATLAEAKGIWFGGGRQWRFVDAYEDTGAVEAFHDVLKRGGVIGGSSAGATIQGDYLCRGGPLGNLEIMVEGYERGFAFLPGVAIDQHFAQRNRFADMSKLMAVHPQFLGIGLDEGTAIVVTSNRAEVVGASKVHFFDRRKLRVAGEPDYVSVSAGEVYDLKSRQVVAP